MLSKAKFFLKEIPWNKRTLLLLLPESYIHSLYNGFIRAKSLFPFTRYPLSSNLASSPIFIVGAPRSGNTLLRRILTSHPSIHIPPETYILSHCIDLYRQLSHMRWDVVVDVILSRIQYHNEFHTMELNTLSPLRDSLVSLPKTERSLSAILDGFYRFHASAHGKTRCIWGDKTPLNVFALRRINRVFPKARYIHIVRHGLDQVASYVKLTGCGVAYAAWDWKRRIEKIKSFENACRGRFLEVKYEDLVCYPQETTEGLCAFLGVEFSEWMLTEDVATRMGDVQAYDHHSNVKNAISPDCIGKGFSQLSGREISLVLRQVGSTLNKLGYSMDPRSQFGCKP